MKYEIRQIDAWGNDIDGFEWNESWHIGEFTTNAKNRKRAFCAALRNKYGIAFYPNTTLIYYDGDVYEICDRKTKRPLFAAIPMYN